MPQHDRQKINLCEEGILAKKAGWNSGGHHIFLPDLKMWCHQEGSGKKCGARHCPIPPFLEESGPRTS